MSLSITPSQAPGGTPRPARAEAPRPQYLELKANVHRKLLNRLNLEALASAERSRAEAEIRTLLFELIAERYERRSLMITCNQPFGEWGQIFPDPAVTVAAIDRLVHHATILELNTESYRRRAAARSASR